MISLLFAVDSLQDRNFWRPDLATDLPAPSATALYLDRIALGASLRGAREGGLHPHLRDLLEVAARAAVRHDVGVLLPPHAQDLCPDFQVHPTATASSATWRPRAPGVAVSLLAKKPELERGIYRADLRAPAP